LIYLQCFHAFKLFVPVVGARFSVPVQTGFEIHSASYTMGTGIFPGGKVRPGRGVHHPTPSSAEVKERVDLRITLSLSLGLRGLFSGERYLFTFVLSNAGYSIRFYL
jgi:hypothetical protein